jgi:hypothetical protein
MVVLHQGSSVGTTRCLDFGCSRGGRVTARDLLSVRSAAGEGDSILECGSRDAEGISGSDAGGAIFESLAAEVFVKPNSTTPWRGGLT